MEQLAFHPIANIYPLLFADEFDVLRENIATQGLLQPLVLYEGKILDGRNRYLACQAVGIDAGSPHVFEGTPLEAIQHVVSLNDTRRHLTSSQRAACEYRRVELVAEYGAVVGSMTREAKATQGTRTDLDDNFSQTFEKSKDARSVEALRAKVSGTNRQYIHDMKKIGAKAPDAVDSIISGEKSVTQVLREIRKAESIARIQAFPSQKYRVLYADIPVTIVALDDVVRAEHDENVLRKNVQPSEAVAIAKALRPLEEAAARERETLGKVSLGSARGRVVDRIAKNVGMSGRSLEKATKVVEAAEAEPGKYTDLVEAMDKKGKINNAYKQMMDRQYREKIATAPAPLPSARFALIYADPPWQYAHMSTSNRAIENQYATMTLEAICARKAGNTVLFPALAFLTRALNSANSAAVCGSIGCCSRAFPPFP